MKTRKNKRKGFTLIEVVGVLIILSIIFVLAFPAIINYFSKAENSIDEATKNIIIEATKDYMDNNVETYRVNDKIVHCISLDILIENNLVTQEQLANMENLDQYVKVSYNDSSAQYEISDTCTPSIDSTFVLNGESDVTLKLSEHYEELGAKALDENDNDISGEVIITIYNSKGEVVDYIDTLVPEIYNIKYDLNVLNIYSKQIERTVRVIDDIAPVIMVDLLEDNFEDTVLTYDILSKITVSDNSGEAIKPVVTTDLSLGVSGIYKVNIKATDSSGNTSSLDRQIQVYTRELSYPAVAACSNGRTLDANGNCIYEYVNNQTQCGCKTYASCENSACGVKSYKSCETSVCGVASYNSCQNSVCGVASYNSCSTAACGAKTCATAACGAKTCQHSNCGYNSCVNSSCTCAQLRCTLYKSCTLYRVVGYCTYNGKHNSTCFSSSTETSPARCNTNCTNACTHTSNGIYSHSCTVPGSGTTGRQSACGTETVYGSACNNANSKVCNTYNSCEHSSCGAKTCQNSACGYNSCQNSACGYNSCQNSACGIASYKSCATSACGIKSYKSCENSACGIASYNSCSTSACGCSVGNDCTKIENNYKIYTCPNGGTLNGTVCEL